MQLAISAMCRAQFGDNELFDIAFRNFEEEARRLDDPPSDEQIKQARHEMETAEATEPNPFAKGICAKLREHLIPLETAP